jgi:hypothetical protein
MGKSMKHFSLEQWTDFVRGVGEDGGRIAMAAHLDAGCARCAHTVDVLRRAANVLATEGQYQVPEYALRCARAIFSTRRASASPSARIPIHLIYDSIREPVPAGMRSSDRLTRRALYQAENFFLDLRLERDPGSPRLNLVGQLANCDTPAQQPCGVLVLLAAGEDVVARAVTNRFGEFELEYEPAANLRLLLPIDVGGGRIELPLSRMTADALREGRPAKVLRDGERRSFRTRRKATSE